MNEKYITKSEFKECFEKWEPKIFKALDELEERLNKKASMKSKTLEKKMLNKDMGKFYNIEKQQALKMDFRQLQKLKAEEKRQELENLLGYNKPAEVPDAYAIATNKLGANGFRVAKAEIAKAKQQAIKKFLAVKK